MRQGVGDAEVPLGQLRGHKALVLPSPGTVAAPTSQQGVCDPHVLQMVSLFEVYWQARTRAKVR